MTSKTAEKGATYADAGVDIAAGNRLVNMIGPAVDSTRRSGVVGALGGFGGLFDPKAAGHSDSLLVAATDGVGTKLRVAIDCGVVDTVGIDLVAMCVNDLVVQGAEPLFFLDYYATGRLDADAAAAIVAGIAEGCRQAGAALIGGETAEMPGMYAAGDFDLAGFAVGAVARDALLPRPDVAEGDLVLGLAASGLHSNGFSLVRKLIADAGLDLNAPPPFASEAATLGEALLTPTRIYVRPLLKALAAGPGIKALAHITGGGLIDNLPRVLPDDLAVELDLGALVEPPVLAWVRALGTMATPEYLRTFNAGIGMAAVVAADAADRVRRDLEGAGETVRDLGRIVPRSGEAVVTTGELGGP